MRYKLLLFFTLFFATIFIKVNAQVNSPRLSFKLYGGYGLLSPGGDRFDPPVTQNQHYLTGNSSPGAGGRFGAGLSYRLNNIVSIGIDADYATGSTHAAADFPTDSTRFNLGSSHRILNVVPNVSFSLYSQQGYSIYNTIGIMATLNTKYNTTYRTVHYGSGQGDIENSITDGSWKYAYGFNGGVTAGLGVKFKLAGNVMGFTELAGYYLVLRPKSSVQNESINYLYVPEGDPYTKQINTNTFYYKRSGSLNYQVKDTQFTSDTAISSYSQNTAPISQHAYSIGLNVGVVVNIPAIK